VLRGSLPSPTQIAFLKEAHGGERIERLINAAQQGNSKAREELIKLAMPKKNVEQIKT